MSSAMVHVRVDEEVKEKAAAALKRMGMSVSDAVRMMLVRVAAEKALPFEVRVPNATTVEAMRAADRREGKRFASPEALFEDLEQKQEPCVVAIVCKVGFFLGKKPVCIYATHDTNPTFALGAC